MADAIDKVQQNSLLPYEQMLKDKKTSAPSKVDIVGITKEYWMSNFREMWETEYPKTVDDLSDEHWASWFKNFAPYTRQDIEYSFNEIRKKPRDFPPSLSIVYNHLVSRAESKIRADEFKVKGGCDCVGKTCFFHTEYWMMDKYGKYTFVLLCENRDDKGSCDNYKVVPPTEHAMLDKPKEDMTKAKWLRTVASIFSNTDDKIHGTNKTEKDRKYELAAMCELFADGELEKTLELFNIPASLSFTEICLRISEVKRKSGLLNDINDV